VGKNSSISWTDHTFNPWIGCTKVSAGCANCYAEREDARRGWTPGGWGPGKLRRRTSESNWRQPLKWDREAAAAGKRAKVFCASLADVFDQEIDNNWRVDLFDLIHRTPNLDWLLLTKRIEAMRDWVEGSRHMGLWGPPANVWCGVSVEDQATADERLPILIQIPAAVRWVSYEPALGPVDFTRIRVGASFPKGVERPITIDSLHDGNICLDIGDYDFERLHWIIVGGESGPKARPFDLDWARSSIEQCRGAGAAAFVKQLGSNPTKQMLVAANLPENRGYVNVPIHLNDHKGADPAEWPEDLRVQEFPR